MWKLIFVAYSSWGIAIEEIPTRSQYGSYYDYSSLESCQKAGQIAYDTMNLKGPASIYWMCLPSKDIVEE